MLPPPLQGIADFAGLRWRRAHLKGQGLRAYQQKSLARLLRLATEGSAFYRELYAGRDLRDIRSLPTIDKSVMMRAFDRLNTAGLKLDEVMAHALDAEREQRYLGYFRGRYVIGLSSGTSGARGLYVWDRAFTRRLPFVFLARSGMPWSLLPFRIAFFLRVFSQGFQDINGPLISLRHVPTMTPVDEAVERINALRTNILMGPPSMLRLLARKRHAITSPIGMVVSYAEVLEEHDREMLERTFGVRVVEIYQASEGLIGCPCSEGRLHVNEDLVYLELQDEGGREITEPGVPCARMLVTNLYNEVQPLIRYVMNDLVELGPPCECGSGFRVIRKIIGRDDDVLYFRRPEGTLGHLFPDLMSRWIITATDGILEYVVEQPDPGHLAVHLDLAEGRSEREVGQQVISAIRHGLTHHGLTCPDIKVLGKPGGIRPSPGKFKRFRRGFTPAADS